MAEYTAGTDPTDANDVFRIELAVTGETAVISFDTVQTDATQDEWDRYYSLEYTTNSTLAGWLGVSGYTNMPAGDRRVNYANGLPAGAPFFYRGRVWLQRK